MKLQQIIVPVEIYTNKLKSGIVFLKKTCYKLELLLPETIKLLESKKDMLIKIKMERMCQI